MWQNIFLKNSVFCLILSYCSCYWICAQGPVVDAENHYQIGLKFYQEQKIDEALTEFIYSLSRNPMHDKARFNKAMIHINRGEYNKAILDLEELRKYYPNYDKANYFLGFSKYKIEALDSALSDLKKETKLHPQHFEPYYLLGRIFLMSNKIDSSIYYLQKAQNLNPNYINSINDMGVCYLSKNSYDTAIFYFQKAIEIKSESAISYRDLGIAYYHKSMYQEAIIAFNHAVDIDSTDYISLNNLGAIYYITQNYIESQETYSKSIINCPYYLPAYINRSMIYIEIGQYEKAIADLDYYISQDDKNGVAYLNRGIANENVFRWKDACRDWQQASDLGIEKANKYIKDQCKE